MRYWNGGGRCLRDDRCPRLCEDQAPRPRAPRRWGCDQGAGGAMSERDRRATRRRLSSAWRQGSALRTATRACPRSAPRDRWSAPLRPEERWRSEEHTSELQSLMRSSYAGFCLKKKNINNTELGCRQQLHKQKE